MKLVLFIFALFSLGFSWSQTNDDCSNASIICAGQSFFSSNENASADICNGCADGATSSGNFCFAPNNTVWFTFTTNEIGGNVDVSFENINCNSSAGFNTNLQAVMIAAGSPCDESTYTQISNCESGTGSTFTLSATNLNANTTYFIQVDGDSIAGNTSPAQCGFNVTLSGDGVEYLLDAGNDTTINFNSSAELEGSGPSGSVWTPSNAVSNPDQPTTVTAPNSTTTYYYSYTADNGCVYSDEVTVTVLPEILITNTFSPNDDGYNDLWEIKSIENYPSVKIDVFDRWGQKVFHTVGYGNEKKWDGTFGGARLPEGVYYYYIDLNTGDKANTYAGYVTLLK